MYIIENSITSGASEIRVKTDRPASDTLTFVISDNGSGMSESQRKKAMDPFYTTKAGKHVGLGLALFRQAAEETGGTFAIDSDAASGTTVQAVFHTDHPDMKPFGDIAGTVAVLRACHPEIDFLLECDPITSIGEER